MQLLSIMPKIAGLRVSSVLPSGNSSGRLDVNSDASKNFVLGGGGWLHVKKKGRDSRAGHGGRA